MEYKKELTRLPVTDYFVRIAYGHKNAVAQSHYLYVQKDLLDVYTLKSTANLVEHKTNLRGAIKVVKAFVATYPHRAKVHLDIPYTIVDGKGRRRQQASSEALAIDYLSDLAINYPGSVFKLVNNLTWGC